MSLIARTPLVGRVAFAASVAGLALATGAPAFAQVKLPDLEHRTWPTISAGTSLNGSLDSSDVLRDDGSYTDGFFYDAQQGETVTFTMRSSDFDSWLVVDDPGSSFMQHDDDSGGGNDARLTVTFPHAGRYLILANDVRSGATGNYTLTVARGDQSSSTTPAASASTGARATLADLQHHSWPTLLAGASLNGRLDSSDLLRDDGTYADGFFYDGQQGETITVTLRSSDFDAWLVVDDPNGPLHQTDDDGAGGHDSRITVTLPHAGRYLIVANSLTNHATGNYALSLTSDRQGAAATTATNDLDPDQKARCEGDPDKYPLDVQIGACTALLQGGHLTDDNVGIAFQDRGVAYALEKNFERALADFNDSLRVRPNNAHVLALRGSSEMDLQRYDAAEHDFAEALRIDPKEALAYNGQGRLKLRSKDYAAARDLFARAVSIDSTEPIYLENRAFASNLLGDRQQALADYAQAIRFNPKDEYALFHRADVYESLHRYSDALADLDRLVELNPTAWNHNLACWERAAFLGTDLDRAKSECDKAVELDPKNPEILDSRAMLRLKLKQYASAWADYDAAIRINPKNASYWYGRAMAERAQGKTAAASADVAKAKALNPKIAETYASYGIKP